MSDILTLAKKMERALRNGTGFNVTADEMLVLSEIGVIDRVHGAKLEELKARCPVKRVPTRAATTGSTSAGTEHRPMSGRSPATSPEAGRSFIEALGFGT